MLSWLQDDGAASIKLSKSKLILPIHSYSFLPFTTVSCFKFGHLPLNKCLVPYVPISHFSYYEYTLPSLSVSSNGKSAFTSNFTPEDWKQFDSQLILIYISSEILVCQSCNSEARWIPFFEFYWDLQIIKVYTNIKSL